MELRTLQGHIRTLASLPETRAPVVSCYLRVEGGRLKHRRVFSKRIEELRRSFAGEAAQLFEEAIAQIERFLSVELQRGSKGVAVFSRSGRQPFFLALQFYVPLPTWIAADTLHLPPRRTQGHVLAVRRAGLLAGHSPDRFGEPGRRDARPTRAA